MKRNQEKEKGEVVWSKDGHQQAQLAETKWIHSWGQTICVDNFPKTLGLCYFISDVLLWQALLFVILVNPHDNLWVNLWYFDVSRNSESLTHFNSGSKSVWTKGCALSTPHSDWPTQNVFLLRNLKHLMTSLLRVVCFLDDYVLLSVIGCFEYLWSWVEYFLLSLKWLWC